MQSFIFSTPLGNIEASMKNNVIYTLNFTNNNITLAPKECLWLVNKIENYFKGLDDLKNIDIHLDGTDFQKRAWKALMDIPYGEVISYKKQAEMAGNIKAVRAIGNANSKNKIALIVP